MKDEIERRASNTKHVLAYFKKRPHVWIPAPELAHVGGFLAWRTRVSDARSIVKDEGGDIEWNGKATQSAYRYVPVVERDEPAAAIPSHQPGLFS